MSPRYVIARRVMAEDGSREWSETVVNLPDAEHIHVHIAPDGSVTAVPMRRPVIGDLAVRYDRETGYVDAGLLWVDAPEAS